MPDRGADLHVHTTASDGALSPTEAVQAAHAAGLAAVGIADHDTVTGIAEALEAAERFDIEVVPAVEVSTVYGQDSEAHILGYFIDYAHPLLIERLDDLKMARHRRGESMVEKLNLAGVPITFERVAEIAKGGAIGRPHVARAIVEVGAASSMDSAFGRYLLPGGPGYVPRKKISPHDAVRLIVQTGGTACCAHVGKLRSLELIPELIECGLRAIEIYHPDHSSAATRFFHSFAKARSLIATGGSDSHGIGGCKDAGIGSIAVHSDVVEQLREATARQ